MSNLFFLTNTFNSDKIYITNELVKTGRPVTDADRGLINPPVLKMSEDTLRKLKGVKNA